MRLSLEVDGLEDLLQYETDRVKSAATRALKDVVDEVKESLRAQTRAAGFSDRLAMTWQSQVYPKDRDSLGAAGIVYSKAPEIIEAFETGATIKGRNSRYLAIPLPPAREARRATERTLASGKTKRVNERFSPSNWDEARFGPLRLVPRGNKPALLVADGLRARKSGKSGGFTKARARKETKTRGSFTSLDGITSVPMFVLVRAVKMQKRLDVESAMRPAVRRLPAAIAAILDRV